MDTSLQQMCRTCLGAGVALISLHANPASSQTCTVGEMLGKFTTITVTENDGLPSKVCLACVSEIKRSYFFKIKCESSQDTLQEILKEISPVKKAETNLKEQHLQLNEMILETYTTDIEGNEAVAIARKNDEATANGKVDVIVPEHRVNSDDFPDDAAPSEDPGDDGDDDNQLLEQVHDIVGEAYEMDQDQSSFVINQYMGNSSDDDSPADGVVIIACEECYQTFETRELFEAHAADCSRNVGAKPKKKSSPASRTLKKCPECPMDFVHQKNLEKHRKKYHRKPEETEKATDTVEETLRMSEDDEEPENEESMDVPVATVPDDALLRHDPASLPSGDFTCERCGAGFANKKSLHCHMKINKCTIQQFICKVCKKVFISDRNLIEHMKSHTKETFNCSKCAFTFTSAKKLQIHTDKAHNGILKNQCKFCGKVFTMFSTLKDHLRTHSGEKPFLCSICGKGFSQNTNLKQHVMRHKNVKPFACKECDVSFVSKGELNAHIRKHTGDHPFSCDMCQASFTTSSSLVKHKRIHTGERPYACDLCPIRFAALGTLKNHRRTHTGEKPFKCDYCSRSFAQKSDSVTHMRSHTGERPYTCRICGFGFPQSGALKSHMKTHERIKQRGQDAISAKEDDQADGSGSDNEYIKDDILLDDLL